MKHLMKGLMAASALALLMPAFVQAHFTLIEPASWLVENKLGDPQKLGPCGGTSADAGMPTNAIGNVQGNSKLHVKLMETVFHPGHYRIALVANRADLPADPDVVTRDSERGPCIRRNYGAEGSVLADGLFVHDRRKPPAIHAETDIQLYHHRLPEVRCGRAVHGERGYAGTRHGYYCHHCAALRVRPVEGPPCPLCLCGFVRWVVSVRRRRFGVWAART